MYHGPDIILDLLHHQYQFKGTWKYKLLYSWQENRILVHDIIESMALLFKIDTEYEHHYRVAQVLPQSTTSKLNFQEPPGPTLSIPPQRPPADHFGNLERRFPRATSLRHSDCRCTGERLTCPNCQTTKEVTCPKCFTHRGGECNHSDCKGSGKMTHQGCRGSGDCQTCDGTGAMTCRKCKGKGKVKNWDDDGSYYTRCGRCRGSGDVDCSICRGDGGCVTCKGSGKVKCSSCKGTGTCKFCSGKGVKKCPTCVAEGHVPCPLCSGDGTLALLTQDVYDFQHRIDTDKVNPQGFDEQLEQLVHGSMLGLELKNFTSDEFQEKFGIMNMRLEHQLARGRKTFQDLLKTTQDREFKKTEEQEDLHAQDIHRTKLEAKLDREWRIKNQDDFLSKFRLSFTSEERESKQEPLHKGMINQEFTFTAIPVAKVIARGGEKERVSHALGTQGHYDFEDMNRSLSYFKVAAIIMGVFWGMMALAIWDSQGDSFQNGFYAVAGVALLSMGAYLASVIQTWYKDREMHISIIGGTEEGRNTLFTLMLNYLVQEQEAQILDPHFRKNLKALTLQELEYGTTLSCIVTIPGGRQYRITSISDSSFAGLAPAAWSLIKCSNKVIHLVNPEVETQSSIKQLLTMKNMLAVRSIYLLYTPRYAPLADFAPQNYQSLNLVRIRENIIERGAFVHDESASSYCATMLMAK